jgi:hypothetical protein
MTQGAEQAKARHATARRWIAMAILLRSNKKAEEKADKIVFFIDKPAVSAARPCPDRAGPFIGERVAEATGVERNVG